MNNSKRILGILGSAAIVLVVGIMQSSVHAAPVGANIGAIPTVSLSVPVHAAFAGASDVRSLSRSAANQESTIGENSNIKAVNLSKVLDQLPLFAQIFGQLLLGVYGLSLVAGRNADGAVKPKANVIWGSAFIGIAIFAPELISWLLQNSAPINADAALPRLGGCG